MHRVIVVGSPRVEGRSAHLADELFNACIEERPEDGVSIVSVASTNVAPCRACDACARAASEPPAGLEEGDPLEPCALVACSDAALHQCVLEDDGAEVRKHLDAADELVVVAPVYFSGAPAQLKALLDRLQPYYWSSVRKGAKRPMVLHVVGEGGDPHGFEPLIGEVRSAFAVAGFELELVLDWVGKIDESGEIVAEADEYPIPPVGGFAALDLPEGFEFAEAEDAFGEEGFVAGAEGDAAFEVSSVPRSQDGIPSGSFESGWNDEPSPACADGRTSRAQGGASSARERSASGANEKRKLSLADAGPESKKGAKQGSKPQGGRKQGGSKPGGRGGKSQGHGGKSQGGRAGQPQGGRSQGGRNGASGKGRPNQGGKRRG